MAPDRRIAGLVLHFRTPAATLACLRSMLDEGIRDAIVVDNSEDGGRSLAAMSGGLDGLRGAGLRLTLLAQPANLGFAEGVGRGLEAARTAGLGHVLVMNSDAALERGALAGMVAELAGSACVVAQVRGDASGPLLSSVAFYHPLLGLVLKGPVPASLAYPSCCCLLVRDDFVRPDLFDRDFFFYGEDVMLGCELARRGVRWKEASGAVVRHAGALSSRRGSMFYEYHMVRAHWLLARKLARNAPERLVFIAARCVTLPARAAVRSLRTSSLVPWRALVLATLDVATGRRRTLTPAAAG